MDHAIARLHLSSGGRRDQDLYEGDYLLVTEYVSE